VGTPGSSPVPASASVPLFGGFRGKQKRRDGLIAGSPEAAAADREKDRLRKQRARDAQRAAEPPALPAFPDGVPTAPGVGAGPAPAPVPGLGAPDLAGAPVPWDAQTLDPIFRQLLPTIELSLATSLTSRAQKAKLPGEVIAEIRKDAAWPAPTKRAVEIAAPRVAAKWLNRSGLSAEYQDEVLLGTAAAAILAQHSMILRKLDKVIAGEQEQAEETGKREA
jgi:hypothetical protein